uniref:cation channel sperm-associated auxiliary subunit beta n=1 Tax=Euleptes europaea TaxID=460621 RepID=UPI0025410EB0|nr:cation channel sperm-associated auxiliary subunit beta [Euleptes europaea]
MWAEAVTSFDPNAPDVILLSAHPLDSMEMAEHGLHLDKVTCHLFDKQEIDSEQNRRKNLVLYTSAGLAPTIEIFNSSYSQVFYFKMLLAEDQVTWSLKVPRQDIAHNTDVAPTEQWYVKFNMHHGLNMFTTQGTLLDIAREPILRWKLPNLVNISKLIPHVLKMKVTKSPCASDVAIIGLVFDEEVDDCSDLGLLDLVLTNTRLILLTTLGLFISEDLRYGNFHELKFHKPNLCGFEMDDYFRAKVWYNVQCLANQENYEVDYISLTFNKDRTLSQDKTLIRVYKLTNHKLNKRRKFPDFFFPDPKFEGLGMFFHPNSHFLYVYGNQVWLSDDGGNKFKLLINLVGETVAETDTCVYTQAIIFVTDTGSVFYTKAGYTGTSQPSTSNINIYIVSNLVFNTNPKNEGKQKNKQTLPSPREQLGVKRYAKLTSVEQTIFYMNFDHLGDLYRIILNETSKDFLAVRIMDVNTLLQEDDLAFDGALSPQYITEEQIMFFSHIPPGSVGPRFYNLYIGKALEYGMGGSGIINKVFEHNYPPYFSSSIVVDVLDRFPIEASTSSPCVLNTLTILQPDPGTTAFKLQLGASDTHIFLPSDIEKTVVIPGFSSFLITDVKDDLTALADATMPHRAPLNTAFKSRRWFLYDFGTTNGRKWRVVVDRCRYTIQQLDDLPVHVIKYLDLGSTLNFSFRVTPVNVAYQVFRMHLMEVIVGNPSLLVADAEDHWDDTDSYIMNLKVQSRFFEQGKTSIAVIVIQASLVCDVTTLILTLKNSCSYLKVMHYTLPVQLSASDWLSQLANASKQLKNLPVNYRPPSRLGIAVPLTENFYNVDPEQPRMRDYFQGSKTSGTYKQCANKTKRPQCGCTDNMKLSFFVAFSDCKEKAIRMKYPVLKLPLSFTVENEDGSVNLSSPYFVTITEVNNRTNWEVSAHYSFQAPVQNINSFLGIRWESKGSELFHFRVTAIPGVSFCNLFDEFQIYIDDAPLAFPGQSLISSITAVLIGVTIFGAFILEVYEIPAWSLLKKRLRKASKMISIISLTTSSSTSTETDEK